MPPEVMWARPRTSTVGAQQLDAPASRRSRSAPAARRRAAGRGARRRAGCPPAPSGRGCSRWSGCRRRAGRSRRRPAATAAPSTIASRATVPKQAPETSTLRTRSPSWASSPPGISTPASSAPRARPTPICLADRRVGLLDRDVVEHRQRLGADADHVVDVHRHAVDPDRVEAAELLGDQQLGPDPVGRERDPGPLVDLDHARVVARQRHLQRGPPELDRPQRPHQPGDRGVGGALVDPGLRVGASLIARRSFARTAAARPAR